MPGDVSFHLDGTREMERLLKELGPRVARRVAAQALRAGAKPIVRRAKQLVPVMTGELRDAIAAEMQRRTDSDSRAVRIGAEAPASRRLHLTEFGTAHSPAQPFMRPAIDQMQREALDEMGKVLTRGINREAEKLAGVRRRRGRPKGS